MWECVCVWRGVGGVGGPEAGCPRAAYSRSPLQAQRQLPGCEGLGCPCRLAPAWPRLPPGMHCGCTRPAAAEDALAHQGRRQHNTHRRTPSGHNASCCAQPAVPPAPEPSPGLSSATGGQHSLHPPALTCRRRSRAGGGSRAFCMPLGWPPFRHACAERQAMACSGHGGREGPPGRLTAGRAVREGMRTRHTGSMRKACWRPAAPSFRDDGKLQASRGASRELEGGRRASRAAGPGQRQRRHSCALLTMWGRCWLPRDCCLLQQSPQLRCPRRQRQSSRRCAPPSPPFPTAQSPVSCRPHAAAAHHLRPFC